MFAQRQEPGRHRWNNSLILSLALHGVVLLALVVCYRPVFVQPSFMVRGNQGESILVYAAQAPQRTAASALAGQKLMMVRLAQRRKSMRKEQKAAEERPAENPAASAGSQYGSQQEGATTGDEIRPALPMVFPDPPRAGIPANAIGDVIVEITIDTEGNVVDEKVLQTLGFGIEERVVAVLRGWRFRPATRNGVAILSKQDVHFHFPS